MRFSVLLALLLIVPAIALAGNPILGGPLVYCANPPECQACDLVQTANNIIRFAVAFSVIIATLAFLYAGILYFTAAADPKSIEKAHGIFKSVFVGLVILLVAWLVIDIVMRTLTESKWGPWNEISCQNYPNAGNLERGPGAAAPGSEEEQAPTRPTPYTPPGGRCAPMTTGPCAVNNIRGVFGNNAEMMSSVCRWEMSGRTGCSGTDKLWYGGQSFSCGPWQANLTTNVIYCPNGQSFNCPAAFNPPSNPGETRRMCWPGIGCSTYRATTGWGMTIKDQRLYNTCVSKANDVQCSAETARRKLGNASSPNTNHWYHWQRNCGATYGEGR